MSYCNEHLCNFCALRRSVISIWSVFWNTHFIELQPDLVRGCVNTKMVRTILVSTMFTRPCFINEKWNGQLIKLWHIHATTLFYVDSLDCSIIILRVFKVLLFCRLQVIKLYLTLWHAYRCILCLLERLRHW